MRPQLLKFSGIGAFPGMTEIDFEDLEALGLYLIVGPTGSGKTTIFDALTFALYGKAAGRPEGMLVSDYEGRLNPMVELSFLHGNNSYVVHREPAIPGKNINSNKQWLREFDASGREARTITGAQEINKAIIGIVGLDAEQFMQVVLLPQGKFQKFLMAKSSERTPLLQAIFGTVLYNRTATILDEMTKGLEAKAADTRAKIDQEQATISSVLASLRDSGIAFPVHESHEELVGVIRNLSGQHQALIEKEDVAARELESATAAHALTEVEVKRFDAAQELAQALKSQEKDEGKAEESRLALEAHERAKRLMSVSDNMDKATVALKMATVTAGDERKQFERIIKEVRIDAPSLGTLRTAVASASPATLGAELQKISKLVDEVIDANDRVERESLLITKREQAEKNLSSRISENKKTLTKLKSKRVDTEKRLRASEKAEATIELVETRIENLKTKLEAADVEGAERDLALVQKKLALADAHLMKCINELNDARKRQHESLAGQLAVGLKKGSPCGVCGSKEHPRKAPKVKAIDLAKFEKARDKAQKVATEMTGAVRLGEKQLAEAKKHARSAPKKGQIDALQKKLDELSDLADQFDELDDLLETLDFKIEELVEEQNDLGGKRSAVETEIKGSRNQVGKFDALAKSLGDIHHVKDAKGRLAKCLVLVKSLEKAVTTAAQAETAVKTSEENLAEALKAESFPSVTVAKKALLTDVAAAELRKFRAAFEEQARRITELKGTVGSEPVSSVRPKIDEVAARKEQLKAIKDEISVELNTLGSSLKTIKSSLDKIENLGPNAAFEAAQAEEARAFAKVVVSGFGVGEGRRMALEEWVQRILFEEVCVVATQQLARLSSNRYILTMDSDGAKTKRGARGLELYVLDTFSGKRRSVETLSGGEQFITALALALSLAEVVQRHAGGIKLSTLFIDEGFGSLDADSLETAIDVLEKLQDSGRSVGLITHVDSMQKRLPLGIRVNKTANGSTLELRPVG